MEVTFDEILFEFLFKKDDEFFNSYFILKNNYFTKLLTFTNNY